jgi:hypothetical protein
MSHVLVGQQNVLLEIRHMLGDKVFQFDKEGMNNLGHPFTLRRMDYFLSGLQITHDGGKTIVLPDLYVLVSLDDNQEKTIIDLGSHSLTNIEKITFYLGLDSLTNHSDPALWQIGHPLGPRIPSMHWGWAAGYRFIALEGKGGPANNQEIQLHALGNQYFLPMTFDVTPVIANNTAKIQLAADYSRLFYDIPIKQGVIVHGSDKEIIYLSRNFVDKLFTVQQTSDVSDNEIHRNVSIFPNPAQGEIKIELAESFREGKVSMQLTDVVGRTICQQWVNHNISLPIQSPGTYFIHIRDEKGNHVLTKKLIVS